MLLDKVFSGKIRVYVLTKLLLNPGTSVYLRGLQRDLGVSSNTVRVELNKLAEIKLIKENNNSVETGNSSKAKYYSVNIYHPLYKSLRGVILQYVGLEQIVENVLRKLGDVEKVFLTGDLAQGNNSPFIDLVIVGNIDKYYMYNLVEKAEKLINKKIRIGIYQSQEFNDNILKEMGVVLNLME